MVFELRADVLATEGAREDLNGAERVELMSMPLSSG
jgi:hypothetical protein